MDRGPKNVENHTDLNALKKNKSHFLHASEQLKTVDPVCVFVDNR